ncbi:PLP-dependent aminotransferase family protein [Agrobacterium tumefaciens]|uniref:Aspartate aminotransferase n=1 Tax=Agrobacterium tumefaciens TaxID=358 RepID=A0A176XFJ5_AGRTU|nr:PLP-dependent aminotransferase family protein [Agrobacterium tumefaciens]OAE48391.1 aspartate aminotransferase [Agrobacterium tumefaciens]
MRLKSPWKPRLNGSEGNPSTRLLEALSEDILAGILAGGERLPPHRELAWTLGLGVGTVTKAYAVLERRGLARSIKGRGTFVATLQAQSQATIDFSVNTIPPMLSDRLLARTLSTVSRKIDTQHVQLRPPLAGHDAHRRIFGKWLESLGIFVEPNRIMLTGSGQQALWLAFDTLCGGRGLIITERLSYPGAVALARHRGHPIAGVEIDAEGMIPHDLARVLDDANNQGGRRLVYTTPSLQNPTTATMSLSRRQEIIEICHQRDVLIVEDGVYTLGHNPDYPPLVTLAPEAVFHVTSLSKTLTSGLRLGVLVLPEKWVASAEEALQIIPLAASPLDYSLLEEWFSSGVVEATRTSLRAEASRRAHLAASLFSHREIVTNPAAFHAWVPMPHAQAEAFVSSAEMMGVIITPPDAMRANRQDELTGIRLCLGGPSFDELSRGLSVLAKFQSGSV